MGGASNRYSASGTGKPRTPQPRKYPIRKARTPTPRSSNYSRSSRQPAKSGSKAITQAGRVADKYEKQCEEMDMGLQNQTQGVTGEAGAYDLMDQVAAEVNQDIRDQFHK